MYAPVLSCSSGSNADVVLHVVCSQIPVGSNADVVLPAKLLGVDTTASTTIVTDGVGHPVAAEGVGGDLVVRGVGSGSYTFVLSAA